MDEKIIKARPESENGTAASRRILKKDVYEAGLSAHQVLEVAAKEAQALIEDAEQRRDAIVEGARQEGFRHGIAKWEHALASARQAQEALDTKYEPEIVRLAVKIAEKIIGEELHSRPETIVSIARECLRGVRHEHSLTVRVNPAESDEVKRDLASLTDVTGSGRRIQVVADATVSSGGCIVDSVVGVIDARLETQLGCLEEILLRVAARH
jgi:type III secretion protein L